MIWRGRSSSSLAKEGPCVDPSDALRIAKKRKGGSISFSFFFLSSFLIGAIEPRMRSSRVWLFISYGEFKLPVIKGL